MLCAASKLPAAQWAATAYVNDAGVGRQWLAISPVQPLKHQCSCTLCRFDDFSAYWISYLRYLAVLPHVLAGAVRAEMAGQEFDCSGGLPQDMVTAVGDLLPTVNLFRSDYVQNLLRNPGPDCKIYGDQMMEYFGFSGSSTGKVFGIVLGYLGVVHLLTYVAVVVVTRKERR
jgi:hypothetical protein